MRSTAQIPAPGTYHIYIPRTVRAIIIVGSLLVNYVVTTAVTMLDAAVTFYV